MSAPQFSNPSTMPPPVGAYSHCALVKAGSDILYLAGQVGERPDGSLPADVAGQATEVFANIVRALEANGMTPAHLAKITLFVVHGQSLAGVRAARGAAFGDAKPASTLIFVPQLADPKYLIEVEAIAAR